MQSPTSKLTIWSGAFFLAVFCLFHGGHFYHVDEELHFLTASSILDGAAGAIPPRHEAYYRGELKGVNDFSGMGKFGLGGKFYAKSGVGQALALVPVVACSRAVTKAISSSNPQAVERLIASFFCPVIAAAGLALWINFIAGLGYSRLTAFSVACAIGLSTFYFVQAKFFMNHMLVAVLLILGLLCIQRASTGSTGLLLLAGFCAGWIIFTRIDSFMFAFLVPFFWLLKSRQSGQAALRPTVGICLAMIAPLLLLGIWNLARFGHAMDFGYNISDPSQPNYDQFNRDFFPGFLGQIFDFEAGLIWYAPILLVAVAGMRRLFQRSPPTFWLAVLGAALPLVFYARFDNWAGNISWGPRFLLPSVPLVALGLAPRWQDWRGGSRWLKLITCAVVGVGIAVQLSGSLLSLIHI